MQEDSYIDTWKADRSKKKSTASKIFTALSINQSRDLDEMILPIYQSVAEKIDCLGCANCCKTTVTTFTEEDITRIAKFLGISKKSFINQYIIDDEGEYTTITTPCPFLEQDNKCAIYEVRPQACSSFPHLHRKKNTSRRKAHIENFVICPITYHTLNQIFEKIVK